MAQAHQGPHNFVFRRIEALFGQIIQNQNQGNFLGINQVFNIQAGPENALRCLVMMRALIHGYDLFNNNNYLTVRDLKYLIEAEILLVVPWRGLRENLRTLEDILRIPRHTLPFVGRPEGRIALG